MNNYEYIKKMSFEEMQKALNNGFFNDCRKRKCDINCFSCYGKWLKTEKI